MKYVLALIGLIIGSVFGYSASALLYALVGFLVGQQVEQRRLIRTLTERFDAFHLASLRAKASTTPQTSSPEPEEQPEPCEPATISQKERIARLLAEQAPAAETNPWLAVPDSAREWQSEPASQPTEETGTHTAQPQMPGSLLADKVDLMIKRSVAWFTTGNPVVKVGLIVLFFGVAFLLKYAAENSQVPIEVRFIGAAIGALAILLTGWRLRESRPLFALPMQGGGMGLLYIILFAAAKLFSLLPLSVTFGLMLVLVALTCVLAVLQNTMSLAVIATVGGFLAPVLTSSGTGSHVALFSYFALLNAGILGIAWFKSWRLLNWLGFVFTFVIASLWGADSYQPEHYATTQPFLILFFLFYVFVSVLYAHRQPTNLKGLVDASLVFGVPLIGFTLQSQLVEGFEFGLAFSSITVSLFYLALARLLWTKQIPGMRLLTECFLALGVLFATLAIPFVVDGEWTGATWALEAAGMIWVGIHQNRLLPRLAGYTLTLAAGVLFFGEQWFGSYQYDPSIFDDAMLSATLIALSGLFAAWQLYRGREHLLHFERFAHVGFLLWGLIWWFGNGFVELDQHLTRQFEVQGVLVFAALSVLVMGQIAGRKQWIPMLWLLPAYILGLWYCLAVLHLDFDVFNPFSNHGALSWLLALTVGWYSLKSLEAHLPPSMQSLMHVALFSLSLLILTWGVSASLAQQFPALGDWTAVLWGLLPALTLYWLPALQTRQPWPFALISYARFVLPLLATYLALWLLAVSTTVISPGSLPYLPVLNVLDLAQALVLLTLITTVLRSGNLSSVLSRSAHFAILGGLGFAWINSVLAHAVHFYAQVPYTLHALADSGIYQSAISILWTLCALVGMTVAKKFQQRQIWIVSASLLALVVLKLFVQDLNDIGTIARIVSFISVGLLMLAVGYVAPIPPKPKSLMPEGEQS